jgi:hypothetical protein
MQGTSTTYPQVVTILNGVGGTAVINLEIPGSLAQGYGAQSARTKLARPGSDTIQYTSVDYLSASSATVDIRATAFNMNIPRIGR